MRTCAADLPEGGSDTVPPGPRALPAPRIALTALAATALFGTILLSLGCGGSDDAFNPALIRLGDPTPSPTASPTPAPTPTPSPSASPGNGTLEGTIQ
jgi:hypothetical protein